MAEAEYSQVKVVPFNEYVEDQQDTIDILKVRYARKGITMADQEAWQYLSWCQNAVMTAMDSLGGPQYTQVGYNVKGQIAAWAAAHYTQQATGVLSPPVGPRFDAPIALTQQLEEVAAVTVETPHGHRGYL